MVLIFVSSGISLVEDPSEMTENTLSFKGSDIPYEGEDITVQAENSFQKFKLVPNLLNQTVTDIRLGSGAYSSFTWSDLPNLWRSVNNVIDFGIYRLDTSVGEVEEPIYWDYRWEEAFPEEYNQFVDGLYKNGVAVNYMLHFWDKEGHEKGEELETPRFQIQKQIQDFLNYTRYVVSHYKGKVQYYTIWSEPDACPGIKCIEVEDYINLVRETVPVIREEDPQAKISIAPNVLYFAQGYLNTILNSEIMTMVDVIQWHGIYNVLPNDLFYDDYYYEYPLIIEGIRRKAINNGFEGEFWATEISWCSEEFSHCQGTGQPWAIPKTDKQAAKYTLRSIVQHLGMNIGVGLMTWLQDVPDWAPWTHPTTSNLFKVMVGVKSENHSVEIVSESTNILTNNFSLPNGDILFALWTHGKAVDDDHGVKSAITFPDMYAKQIIAIDVLNGFEQELITKEENGNLIIQDMFVMDYPIILHIIPTATSSENIFSENTTPPISSWSVLLLPLTLAVMVSVRSRKN
jgi:hypothetical protein